MRDLLHALGLGCRGRLGVSHVRGSPLTRNIRSTATRIVIVLRVNLAHND